MNLHQLVPAELHVGGRATVQDFPPHDRCIGLTGTIIEQEMNMFRLLLDPTDRVDHHDILCHPHELTPL